MPRSIARRKTKKAAVKRIKVTGTGKLMRRKPGLRHLASSKSSKRKRKLGTLQLQMASTSEARASFVQGRKLLLQLKSHGQWNAERARVLAEIESSLRRLPRD